MFITFKLLLVTFFIIYTNAAVSEEESCQSYAGGNVYPLGSDPEKTDHKLQWTKAVSEYFDDNNGL